MKYISHFTLARIPEQHFTFNFLLKAAWGRVLVPELVPSVTLVRDHMDLPDEDTELEKALSDGRLHGGGSAAVRS